MSEFTECCTICLGDIAETPVEEWEEQLQNTTSSTSPAKSSTDEKDDDVQLVAMSTRSHRNKTRLAVNQHEHKNAEDITNDLTTIAHIQGCQHRFHNGCLKLWVEKANSCPMCRKDFNVVEVTAKVDGPVLATYVVQDKQQEADVAEMWALQEEERDEETEPECMICESKDEEGTWLVCGSCATAFHMSCYSVNTGINIDSTDVCPCCTEDTLFLWNPEQELWDHRRLHTYSDLPVSFRLSRGRENLRGTAAQLSASIARRIAEEDDSIPGPFFETASSISNAATIGPRRPRRAPRESSRAASARRDRERREFAQWNSRFEQEERSRVAMTHASRIPRQRTPPPAPDTPEQIRAWSAFERARELEREGLVMPRGRKRGAPSEEPEEEAVSQQQRPLKRPRTRRYPTVADSSITGARRAAGDQSAGPSRPIESGASSPSSFFTSLMDEVVGGPTASSPSSDGGHYSH